MSASKKRTQNLFRRIARVVAPPPKLTVSEWADEYRKLSSEASAEPGQWRTERAPYQREIMDALNDDETETVVVMSSAQVGKTEVELNAIGYFMHQDPSPIMVVQPTLEMAQAFSKDRLAPMCRDSPELKKRMAGTKARDSGNTMLHKTFPGGHITMAGANSPASLASRPIRIVLLDEVDRYPVSAGTEGDPVMLVTKRSTTFHNRKRIMVSTPTVKGASRIETAYENSSMEQWCLPCPSCEEHQPLAWAQIKFDGAQMACKECGCLHGEQEWKAGSGKWIARNQNRKVRGFHLNELASPWKRWETIIEEFKEAKRGGPEMLKAWTNTSMGETWEEQGQQLDDYALMERRENYGSDIPDPVRVLTAAVDTQDDRFEIEVIGWGPGKESWGIEYHVIYGDLKQQKVWDELDEYLQRTWARPDGVRMGIAITCMDSGGHFTQDVYRFCGPREGRRIFAIKGQGRANSEHIPLINGRPTRTDREKALLFNLGVDEGKGKVMSSLMVHEPGPSFCHFPIGRRYDEAYFKGLTAEKLVTRIRLGVSYQVWVKVRSRNEPLDLRVYNQAALEILNPPLDTMPVPGATPAAAAPPRKKVLSKGVSL